MTLSSLVALHPLTNVAGGFVRDDDALAGFVFPARAGTPAATDVSADDRAAIQMTVAQALTAQDLVVRRSSSAAA